MLDDSLPLEGKLTKLGSWSNVPEIDLPALKYLAPERRHRSFQRGIRASRRLAGRLVTPEEYQRPLYSRNERLDRGQPTILTVTPEGLQHIKDWNNLRSLHFQLLQVQRTGVRAFGKTAAHLPLDERVSIGDR